MLVFHHFSFDVIYPMGVSYSSLLIGFTFYPFLIMVILLLAGVFCFFLMQFSFLERIV